MRFFYVLYTIANRKHLNIYVICINVCEMDTKAASETQKK